MDTIADYIEKHKERFLDELFGLIRIPSVSANKENGHVMMAACEYIRDNLLKSGADRSEIMLTQGWPIVYAEKIIHASLPTILVYGHYDVQPPDPLDEWESEPFVPVIRDEKIYARGADDDKGQLFMQLKAFEYLIAEKKLPCNVKFLIEGEEEIGSSAIITFCKQNVRLLSADVILVSDTTILSLNNPTLTIGLRGLVYFEIIVTGPKRDLHSGLYGGTVHNPANVLADIVSGFIDKDGRITIPGFYDSVKEVDTEERTLLNNVPIDEEALKNNIGISDFFGEKEFSIIDRLGIRPTLDVCGIWGGYIDEGAKTILPAKASAKISMRLVPDQNPREIENSFKHYLLGLNIPGISVDVKVLHGGNAYVVPWNSFEVQAAVMAMEKTLGKKALPVRSGGSIPIITDFEKILEIKAVLLGFGLETDAIHSPNENFPLNNFYKGIETIPWFYHFYTEFKKQM